jgi:hypothetical protein
MTSKLNHAMLTFAATARVFRVISAIPQSPGQQTARVIKFLQSPVEAYHQTKPPPAILIVFSTTHTIRLLIISI